MRVDISKLPNGKRRTKKQKLNLLSRLTGGIKGCKASIIRYSKRGQKALVIEYYGYYKQLGGTMSLNKILNKK